MDWLIVLLALATGVLSFVVGSPAFVVAGAIWMYTAGMRTVMAIQTSKEK